MVEAARIALASKETEKQTSTSVVQNFPNHHLRSPLVKAWTAIRVRDYVLRWAINR